MTLELYHLIMYLRKSRQDDPNETVEEVLAKHEIMLQEYCEREFGGRIPDNNIYREVVSGESISSRVEVQKVLARIEDPTVTGVIVIEPSRLSRGDLADCGKLITTLRFSKTLVHTPMMTYNLENKMERKFFQDELLRGNDYLEYTKEILLRGRVAAVKRGCYIGNTPPYGYRKVTIGKDHTLEIIEDEAEIVRLIFDWYIKDKLTPYGIACRLNEMGVESAREDVWNKYTIHKMLKNPHYAGYVTFGRIKRTPVLENGVIVTKRLSQPEEEQVIAEGKHEAIISRETWEMTQDRSANTPRLNKSTELRNPYSGILICKKCGLAMRRHPYKHAEDRYTCKQRPPCYKSIRLSVVQNAIISALEQVELPALELKVKNGDGSALKVQQRLVEKLEKQIEDYRDQEEKQYELLETGKYSQDLFDRRNATLRGKMEECQSALYQARSALPKSLNYEERVSTLKDAIAILKDDSASPADQNKILKSIVEKIEFSSVPSDRENRKRNVKGGVDPFELQITMRL